MLCVFQEFYLDYLGWRYDIIFPGSEILEWFSHQCMGDEVNIMEPFSHLCNEWIGIAVCVVLCPFQRVSCNLMVNGQGTSFGNGIPIASSNHIWLLYLLPQNRNYSESFRKSLWECDVNGFREIGIKIQSRDSRSVKKCGLRVVYKKDIEDLNRTMTQCSNNSIIPYEGLDVPHYNFNNSAVVVEGNKKD